MSDHTTSRKAAPHAIALTIATVALTAILVTACGLMFAWLLVNVAIQCGEPGGSCWLAPWVSTDPGV